MLEAMSTYTAALQMLYLQENMLYNSVNTISVATLKSGVHYCATYMAHTGKISQLVLTASRVMITQGDLHDVHLH